MGDLKSIRYCTFLWVCKSGYIRDACRVLVSVGGSDCGDLEVRIAYFSQVLRLLGYDV